ncbi:hypothetical protein AAFF_G00070770 [Aldrovandia affinis]|uniref:Uncharacterized protein n=1 Tax=Aldrovandia affinis TaxID=143900 RepID=A0AAD7RYU6_9TELE|nr:hypothetical protein AAFF_G00070770 [Aldrovandia affinis]
MMEMQDMKTNEERAEDDHARKEEKTKPGEEDKISEVEKGESVYSKLVIPAEDIYSAPSFPSLSATNIKGTTYQC